MDREEIEQKIKEYEEQIEKWKKTLERPEKVKVEEITDEYIRFNDGRKITFDHYQSCCEHNYADFKQLEDTGIENIWLDTSADDIQFERCGTGFRFGDKKIMFYVPCYSIQNGYYTRNIQIYFDGEKKLSFDAEYDDCDL